MYEHDNLIYHGYQWKTHKYIKKIGNKYIYPEDLEKVKSGILNKANVALEKATGKKVKKIDGKYYYADKKGYETVEKKKAKSQMHKDIIKNDIEPYIKNAKTKEAKEFHTNDKKRQQGLAKKAEKQAEKYTVKSQAKEKIDTAKKKVQSLNETSKVISNDKTTKTTKDLTENVKNKAKKTKDTVTGSNNYDLTTTKGSKNAEKLLVKAFDVEKKADKKYGSLETYTIGGGTITSNGKTTKMSKSTIYEINGKSVSKQKYKQVEKKRTDYVNSKMTKDELSNLEGINKQVQTNKQARAELIRICTPYL